MHIEVLIVNKEALTYCSVSVIECMYIEPTKNEREKLIMTFKHARNLT